MSQREPTIVHVDMDAFYASVEERDMPSLKGRPLAVGGRPEERGVVAAASYAARRFGVRSAMPMATALRLCPGLIVLPARMDYYAEVSVRIRAIFERYTPTIEPLALDEAFLDVAGSERLFGNAEEIGGLIKEDIRKELHVTASVGVAPNKFLAKIASDLDKPDGFVVVPGDGAQAFLDPLPVGRLWGVGPVAERILRAEGVDTVGALRRWSRAGLIERFGKSGEHLWQLAHGIDDRPVVPDHEAKSLSHETTFAEDITDPDVLRAWLMELTEQVARRMRRQGLKGRTVRIKLRFSDFKTLTRAETLAAPTDRTDDLWQAGARLLDARLPMPLSPVRLIGMGVSGFGADSPQGDLFAAAPARDSAVDTVTDALTERFGRNAVRRGRTLRRDGDT